MMIRVARDGEDPMENLSCAISKVFSNDFWSYCKFVASSKDKQLDVLCILEVSYFNKVNEK